MFRPHSSSAGRWIGLTRSALRPARNAGNRILARCPRSLTYMVAEDPDRLALFVVRPATFLATAPTGDDELRNDRAPFQTQHACLAPMATSNVLKGSFPRPLDNMRRFSTAGFRSP